MKADIDDDDKMAVLKQLLGDDRWPLDLRLTSEEITTIEGLTLGDLVKLAERTHLNLRANGSADFKEGLSEAIAATPSAGKRIVKRSDVKEIDFGDVGGLEEVKQKLREVFIWPSKYAVLFGKCGLRLGGGAVLHGPSGCGKTLLARAIGAESALNVISVKGPELLSKYIGASEQNVRELFEKARQTKPSLIIFDEFDALAPKRGHDSTGVTDRVVNQLLTELDGIDSANEGVYVLAATNRMDLIDNALLRPGRFDHKIRVDLPSESDRADTLRVLCREVENVANDVDFDALAKQTDGYTGADLRGLVLTAQFEAIDEASNSDETPTITMKQLQNALSQRKSKSNKQQTREVGHTGAGTRVTLA
uniref:AAA domain-containing protein n=1 Tax=Panagrellus redivivus TaxID=6233 RepID=A0A7E4VRN2_PANRE